MKQPRILDLLAESRPEESEVKSEAAFQRLVASSSELPMQPRTPRSLTDRGRYPEEAGSDECQQESPSDDDDDEGEEPPFAFYSNFSSSEPINISKPRTPGSLNDDELNTMCISGSPSFSSAMDVDIVRTTVCF